MAKKMPALLVFAFVKVVDVEPEVCARVLFSTAAGATRAVVSGASLGNLLALTRREKA
ncbi:MAG: hypothetical protein GY822_13565 [Deltaproteobacteria bacterium]|nr:hypothetical protein [Deltaproteobacteria bacterium]